MALLDDKELKERYIATMRTLNGNIRMHEVIISEMKEKMKDEEEEEDGSELEELEERLKVFKLLASITTKPKALLNARHDDELVRFHCELFLKKL